MLLISVNSNVSQELSNNGRLASRSLRQCCSIALAEKEKPALSNRVGLKAEKANKTILTYPARLHEEAGRIEDCAVKYCIQYHI